jgi:hypothetical protein
MDTYGKPLHPFNGRDPIEDALEEFVDLGQYLSQWKMETTNLGIYLYVYAHIEGFWVSIPPEIKVRLEQIVGDATVEELKKRMGMNPNENEPNGTEDNEADS